ncbi:hypothetical protein [Bacillus sp. PS06]|uniref:hypothetical protein n=1 Tax=Bacillus sp. PS06 TaxID=2764176 RepID=UPI0017834FA3|nr:hypothetical protein [Bacillus sp. PS06]MBD8068554.1 hypothetical protein [Bacillus sp. PS06]
MVNKDSLIDALKQGVKGADETTFPICVDSFTNLWQYEFGSLDDLPQDVDDIIANRAVELGLIELE